MFNLNDKIMYASVGVCSIDEITEKDLGQGTVQYYVLRPLYQKASTVFVPTNNEILLSRMSNILSKKELLSLLEKIPLEEDIWLENSNDRKMRFREILSGTDRHDILSLIRAVITHKKYLEDNGKKLHLSDERYFKEAAAVAYGEISLVLDMEIENIPEYLEKTLCR